MRRLYLLFILIGVLFSACDTSDESLPDNCQLVSVDGGEKIIVRTDSLLMFDEDFSVLRSKPYEGFNDVGLMKGYASFRKEDVWVRCTVGSYWADRLGLTEGKIYYVRKEYYYQPYVQTGENEVVLGFVPNGSCSGLSEMSNGTFVYASNMNIVDNTHLCCRTMLLFFGFDEFGNKVDKYLPCEPENLEWHYFWFKI